MKMMDIHLSLSLAPSFPSPSRSVSPFHPLLFPLSIYLSHSVSLLSIPRLGVSLNLLWYILLLLLVMMIDDDDDNDENAPSDVVGPQKDLSPGGGRLSSGGAAAYCR